MKTPLPKVVNVYNNPVFRSEDIRAAMVAAYEEGKQAALAEPEGEPSTVLRLIDTIKYLVGIAERGEGRKARDDEFPEQFVLGYVKRLEAALAEPSEPVAWLSEDPIGERYLSFDKPIDDYPMWPLFTHPTPSKPEPLTDDELFAAFNSIKAMRGWAFTDPQRAYGRAVEAAVLEKAK